MLPAEGGNIVFFTTNSHRDTCTAGFLEATDHRHWCARNRSGRLAGACKRQFIVFPGTHSGLPPCSICTRQLRGINTNRHIRSGGQVPGIAGETVRDINHGVQTIAQRLNQGKRLSNTGRKGEVPSRSVRVPAVTKRSGYAEEVAHTCA